MGSFEEERKRAEFKVAIRQQTKEDLEKEVYSPATPLDFGESRKLCVYECSKQMKSL